MAKKRICKVCGTTYEHCSNCGNTPIKEYWRNEFCSDDCHEIFKVCSRYVGKDISQKEAFDLLFKYGASKKSIGVAIKQTVDEIMSLKSDDSVQIEAPTTVDVDVIEDSKPSPVIESATFETEEVVPQEEPSFRRSRRNRMKRSEE